MNWITRRLDTDGGSADEEGMQMNHEPDGKSMGAPSGATLEPIGRRAFLSLGMIMAGAMTLPGFPWSWVLGASRQAYQLAPESLLPADIRRAPAEVREAYRFAIANRDVLRYIPCYCGCGDEGHTSNASCYLRDDSKPGNLVFDRMSLN